MAFSSDSHPITNVVYWKNPALSGWVLTGAIIFWAIVEGSDYTVSTLSIRCLQAGLLVSGAFGLWNARYHPQAPSEPDFEGYFQARAIALVPKLNLWTHEMKGIVQWRYPLETLGVLFGLQIVFWVFGFFHSHTLFLTFSSMLMSLPMAYLMNKKEVDSSVSDYLVRAKALGQKVNTKTPRAVRPFLDRVNTRLSDMDIGRKAGGGRNTQFEPEV